ncbi:hypothetical protein [Halorussus caseinilyticus]|uniref:DUF7975 domain-containing protein n=1 Tax=Halorussus caseinilyticus TaxID=3034025 RepID=A0ABD5WPP3_9EURY|nr:hypothetical protein [Halorussus sp. DT72]
MTRFDAATPEDRQKLFAEAITAHRERGSPFATFEASADASALAAETDAGGDGTTGADADDQTEAPPWVQFGDGVLNLDCTDAELDDLKSVLGEFPAFKIDDLTRPEEAEGVNVRVSALADPNRVGQCVERIFREVYDQPESFRAWVVAV